MVHGRPAYRKPGTRLGGKNGIREVMPKMTVWYHEFSGDMRDIS